MARPRKMRDFGGYSYERGSRRSLFSRDNEYSFRCLDCGTLRYVLPRELRRAARPRCLRCGGPLGETETSQERHVAREDAARVASGESGPADSPEPGVRCKECGAKYRDAAGFAVHLWQSVECRNYYWTGQPVVVINGLRVLQGTLHIEHKGAASWHLMGVVHESGLVAIVRCRTKTECLQWLALHAPQAGPEQ